MAKNARTIGNLFEIKVARLLSGWLFPDRAKEFQTIRADALPIRRRPTTHTPFTLDFHRAGDMMVSAVYGKRRIQPEDFPFAVECKRESKWTFDYGVWTGDAGKNFERWWGQATEQASENTVDIDMGFAEPGQKMALCPMLVLTKPLAETFVILPRKIVKAGYNGRFPLLYFQIGKSRVAACRLQDLVSSVPLSTVAALLPRTSR